MADINEGRESKYKVYRKWLQDQDPAPFLKDYRANISENQPVFFRLLKDKNQVMKEASLGEEARGVLEYFRDFLVSMIDITLEPDFLPIFNMKMNLALKVLLEVIEYEEIMLKMNTVINNKSDYEQAISYIWKILLSVCQQNLILDTRR